MCVGLGGGGFGHRRSVAPASWAVNFQCTAVSCFAVILSEFKTGCTVINCQCFLVSLERTPSSLLPSAPEPLIAPRIHGMRNVYFAGPPRENASKTHAQRNHNHWRKCRDNDAQARHTHEHMATLVVHTTVGGSSQHQCPSIPSNFHSTISAPEGMCTHGGHYSCSPHHRKHQPARTHVTDCTRWGMEAQEQRVTAWGHMISHQKGRTRAGAVLPPLGSF